MHLVRPVDDAHRALVRIGLGEPEVLAHAGRAVRLDRPVDDLARHVGRDHLDHRDLGPRRLVADDVHHVRGVEREQPRLVDHAARFGDALVPDRLFGQRLAERDARLQAVDHHLQRALGRADRAHAVVDAPRPEPALRDLEAAALAEQDVLDRHAHVVEQHLHVAVRRVVVAEHRQRAQHRHARRIARHQHHRLLRVARAVGVGLAHHDEDRAARVAGARAEPLAAVDDVVVALAPDAALDVGGVGRGHRRLGHQEGRADLAVEQRLEPALLLRVGAVALQGLHVAGVGRRAVEDLARPRHAAHHLAQRRVVEVRDAALALVRVRQEHVPQPGVRAPRLQFVDRPAPAATGRRRGAGHRARGDGVLRWGRCAASKNALRRCTRSRVLAEGSANIGCLHRVSGRRAVSALGGSPLKHFPMCLCVADATFRSTRQPLLDLHAGAFDHSSPLGHVARISAANSAGVPRRTSMPASAICLT